MFISQEDSQIFYNSLQISFQIHKFPRKDPPSFPPMQAEWQLRESLIDSGPGVE